MVDFPKSFANKFTPIKLKSDVMVTNFEFVLFHWYLKLHSE